MFASMWRRGSMLVFASCAFFGCAEDQVLGPPHQGLTPPISHDGGFDAGGSTDAGGPTRDAGIIPPPEGPCDMTGRWMVHRVGFSTPETALANDAQKASTWYYWEIIQDGDDWEVTYDVWCSTYITGSATVTISETARQQIEKRNGVTGRRGTFKETADGCELDMERIYYIMGLDPYERFVGGTTMPPGVIPGDPALADLEPLPGPGEEGESDWDMDDKPGIAFVVTESPLGSGVRHAVQRNWERLHGPTAQGPEDFMVTLDWDFEENIHEASNPFLMTGAVVRMGAPHQARFVRTDESILGATSKETCDNVREALPHQVMPREEY